VIYNILSKQSLDITGLFEKINEKNDIARATIRGRLSEMVRAGEVKKLASEKFKAIPVEQIIKAQSHNGVVDESEPLEKPLITN